jgi:hypothetical protein
LFVLSDKDNVRKRGRRGKHQQEEADQDQAKILKVLLKNYCCVNFHGLHNAFIFLGSKRRRQG